MINKEFLLEHIGHQLTVVVYGQWTKPDDVCIECEDCNEVIYSHESTKEEETL